jgi:hypothetical protein
MHVPSETSDCVPFRQQKELGARPRTRHIFNMLQNPAGDRSELSRSINFLPSEGFTEMSAATLR